MLRRHPAVLALPVSAALLSPALHAQAGEPSLQDRLDRLVERLEQQRQDLHVPGMAIAIVKDDTVILSRGFGLADVEGNVPATDETLFAAGSTTKAFTAALVAMMVDEGRMSWDDPVRTHLPAFRLTDAEADGQVAIRDLLCHRIGLAPQDQLWYGTGATVQDILETGLQAELLYPFREKFSYSNFSYVAAGMCLTSASGSDWSTLIEERLFKPLGMTSTDTSVTAALADPRVAKGYLWDAQEKKLVHQPMRNVDVVAPAGAINSNVRDMIQWVRLQLGRGEFDGTRLISAQQHQETWTRHITMQGGVDYGLGWFLRTWEGRRVVDHAGGIDGFTAEVAMLPDDNLGFVLLMNQFACPLGETSREIVFGSLLGAWTGEESPPPAEDFQPYLGTYLGNFAQFKDAEFKVLVQGGTLAVDVPGQMIFELKPPDEQGKRPFTMTDQIAVRFNAAEDKSVYSMTIFQSGYTFDLMRRGAEAPVEIDLEAARRYLGAYHDERIGDLTVLVQNNRLAVDVPGQMVYEIYPPDDQGRCLFRVKEGLWVRFNDGADGAVASLTMSQEGNESQMPRLPGPTETLPTVEEVMKAVHAAMGAEHAESLGTIRGNGTIHCVHVGLRGTVRTTIAPDGRSRDDIDLGVFGRIRSRAGRDSGWLDTPALPDTVMNPAMLEQARMQSPLLWLGDWRQDFEQARVERTGDFEGEPVYLVALKPRHGPTCTLMVNVDTGLPAAFKATIQTVIGSPLPVTYRFSDYRAVAGVSIPHRLDMENEVTGRTVVQYEHFEPGVSVPDEAFQREPAGAS